MGGSGIMSHSSGIFEVTLSIGGENRKVRQEGFSSAEASAIALGKARGEAEPRGAFAGLKPVIRIKGCKKVPPLYSVPKKGLDKIPPKLRTSTKI
ncbi:MAG: hypothetical protein ABH833_02320 [Parcubacteria group bacterium]